MAASEMNNKLNWVNILFFILTPITGAIFLTMDIYNNGWSWGLFVLAIVMFSIFNLSITAGYHRYFSHRSYEAHPFLEFLYMFFGSGAFQGSVLEWCTDHRKHHLKVDTNEDPYSINKGFWYAHLLWMFYKHNDQVPFPPDLAKKRMLVLQHKYYVFFAVASGFILPGILGWLFLNTFWGGLIWGGLVRVVLTQHSTFLVNSFAHTFGTQPYNTGNTAKDSLIVAILTFGEGYHNFHHHFQSDYRCAIKWYQWDPTKWMINLMRSMGLVGKVKTFSKYEILIARMNADAHRATVKGSYDEKMAAMKVKAEEAQKRLKLMMSEWEKKKAEFKLQSREKYKVMKAELEIARLEFNVAYNQWRVYLKAVHG